MMLLVVLLWMVLEATRSDGRGEALRQAAAEASLRAGQLASEAKSRAVRGRQERADLL